VIEMRGLATSYSAGMTAFALERWERAGRFLAAESGQDVIEYGMIIATIAVVVLLGVTAFGNEITPWFQQLAGHITTV
jgi:Flp pilus assembly pilin Flp